MRTKSGRPVDAEEPMVEWSIKRCGGDGPTGRNRRSIGVGIGGNGRRIREGVNCGGWVFSIVTTGGISTRSLGIRGVSGSRPTFYVGEWLHVGIGSLRAGVQGWDIRRSMGGKSGVPVDAREAEEIPPTPLRFGWNGGEKEGWSGEEGGYRYKTLITYTLKPNPH